MKAQKKTVNKKIKQKIEEKTGCETNCKSKEIIEKFPESGKQYLIPLLQKVQEENGYVSEEAMDLIAEKLDVPVSRVYAVTTFYSYFRLQPIGRHLLRPCCGTACHVKGSRRIIGKIREFLALKDSDTTPDSNFTLAPVACLGTCGLAPVMMIGENVYGSLDEEKAIKIIEKFKR